MKNERISLAHGSGGKEMDGLIREFATFYRGKWKNTFNDSATIDLGDRVLVFTTDSFIVDPIFFPGGNIGHLAACGTINDLAVMGATPLGISIAAVIEEGLSKSHLKKIMKSAEEISRKTGVPIATGDTKVMEKGKVDKIILNTSGVGLADKKNLLTKKIDVGDKIIISGGIGEHAVAILSKRFDYKTGIKSDSKPLIDEVMSVRAKIKVARDITRGGLAAVANELVKGSKLGMLLFDEKIPAKDEVVQAAEMLGINVFELACEGRFVCIASEQDAGDVANALKKFNKSASVIGEVTADEDEKVVIKTLLGKRILQMPSGRIVPRIC